MECEGDPFVGHILGIVLVGYIVVEEVHIGEIDIGQVVVGEVEVMHWLGLSKDPVGEVR